MNIIHSYTSDQDISTTIFRAEFDILFEHIKLQIQISDLEFFVNNGLDLKINFNEYFNKVQLIKSICKSKDILFYLIHNVFSVPELQFTYDEFSQKLTHLKNIEEFNHFDIKSYFDIVKDKFKTYSEEYKTFNTPDSYNLELVDNNIIFKSNNFYFLINNKEELFNAFFKYFEKYFIKTEKYMQLYIEKNLPIVHKDVNELFNKGYLILNDYSTRDNLTYPDLENVLNFFIPDQWCAEENNLIF